MIKDIKKTWVNLIHQISLVTKQSRILLPMHETRIRSLDLEDPLEKEMSTHSSILAWEIPGTEEPGGLLSVGL